MLGKTCSLPRAFFLDKDSTTLLWSILLIVCHRRLLRSSTTKLHSRVLTLRVKSATPALGSSPCAFERDQSHTKKRKHEERPLALLIYRLVGTTKSTKKSVDNVTNFGERVNRAQTQEMLDEGCFLTIRECRQKRRPLSSSL